MLFSALGWLADSTLANSSVCSSCICELVSSRNNWSVPAHGECAVVDQEDDQSNRENSEELPATRVIITSHLRPIPAQVGRATFPPERK